jgi:hypothetical protein
MDNFTCFYLTCPHSISYMPRANLPHGANLLEKLVVARIVKGYSALKPECSLLSLFENSTETFSTSSTFRIKPLAYFRQN